MFQCVPENRLLNSGRVDRFHGVGDTVDTNDMQADISFLDENNASHKMQYRKYLEKFQPQSVSSDINKFKDMQDFIADLFLSSNGIARSRLRHICTKSVIDTLSFECTGLDVLSNLMTRGFYSSEKRLSECLRICISVIESIGHNSNSNKVDLNNQATNVASSIGAKPRSYRPIASDDSDSSDEDDGGELDFLIEGDSNVVKRKGSVASVADEENKSNASIGLYPTLPNDNISQSHSENYESAAEKLGVLVHRLCRRHDTQHLTEKVIETVFENQR